MGCISSTPLEGISYNCNDKPKGGVSRILVARKSVIDALATITDGVLELSADLTTGDTVEVDFNKKDGFSIAGLEYSGEADGTDSYVPTISVEAPRVTVDKLMAVDIMAGGFNELVVFVQHRTGLWFAYGVDNGVYASAATTTTGTNTDKNTIQFTFTGDEDSFEKSVGETDIAKVVAGLE